MLSRKEQSGFTLLEIVIVAIIVGVLAGVTLPRLGMVVERQRAEEARQMLLHIYGAQQRYALDHKGSYTADKNALDITVQDSPQFQAMAGDSGIGTAFLGAATRLNASSPYTLRISKEGTISCDSTPLSLCKRLGF